MAISMNARRLWCGLVGFLALAATASAQTLVGGNIGADTTWNLAGSPYEITSNVTLIGGATLTIEPGVVVLANTNTTLQVSSGHLSAVATVGSPILFTSVLDSAPGQWDGLIVNGAAATAELQFCEIRYAGQPNAFAVGSALTTSASPSTVLMNCTIRDCSGSASSNSGVYIASGAIATISDTLFENCGDQPSDFAVRDQSGSSVTVSGCHFESNTGYAGLVAAWNVGGFMANTFNANTTNRFRVSSGSTVDGGVMRAQGAGFEGFELAQGDLSVPAFTTFAIEAGVNVFGIDSTAELIVQGRLECLGTELEPIVMTSFDDTPATLWDGVTFNGANATGLMQWTSVRRGGGGNAFAVRSNVSAVNSGLVRFENGWISDIAAGGVDYGWYCSNSVVEIVDSTFVDCGDATTDFAFHATSNNGSSAVQNCLFSNNIGQCARVQPSSVQGFSGCEFSGNSVARIRVNSGTTSAGGMMENMAGLDSWELDNGDVTVPAGVTLTVGPGAWVRGLNASAELLVQGRLECLGTAGEPIVMTSFDDTSATLWDGVTFNGANATGLLQWTSVRRGGGVNAFAVRSNVSAVNAPDVVLEDCEISDIDTAGSDYGLYNSNSAVSCVRTVFRNCGADLSDFGYFAAAANGSIALEDCEFQSNMGQCARVQPGSLQDITGGSFAGNAIGRIRIAAGNTAVDGAMEHIPGMDGWELDTGDVSVPAGAILTVGPGVRVFGINNTAELLVQGRLECLGTMAEPILMTSFDDTNADTWDGVTFNGTNASGLLRWTTVRYGGGVNAFAVRSNVSAVNSPDVVLEDCTISDISTGGSDYGVYNSNSVVNCIRTEFRDCGDSGSDFGFFCASPNGSSALVECGFFDNIGVCALVQANSLQDVSMCVFSANTKNRIRVRSGSTALDSVMHAMASHEGFELDTGDVSVPAGGVLTIDPGVTVFGINDTAELILQGRLECLGTMADPILLTSVDDSDANTWDGVTFNGSNSSALMRWTTVRHGGGGNAFSVRSNVSAVNCPDLVMENCTISDIGTGGNDFGLHLSNAVSTISECAFERCGLAETGSAALNHVNATTRVEDCLFADNPAVGLSVSNGTLSLSCTSFTGNGTGLRRTAGTVFASECSFENNSQFAVENTNNAQLNVCCSWWGDPTGPGAPGGSGAGDPVSENVGFSPFSVSSAACGFDCLMGDANNDGFIDLADLNLVLGNFGDAVEVGRDGDVNDDGVVDLADLNLVLSGFGDACEASA